MRALWKKLDGNGNGLIGMGKVVRFVNEACVNEFLGKMDFGTVCECRGLSAASFSWK